jgi:L-asparaginase / beta-aspartyl-peptidase
MPAMTTSAATDHWAIAIHGGAGEIDRTAPAELQQAYRDALARALTVGRDAVAAGAAALDVVELTVRALEEDPLFNSGRGAAFDALGGHELDASIMDGSTLACGAVAGVRTVRNPIRLARQVLERSGHVLLVGEGAESFADAITPTVPIERVANDWFDTPMRRAELDRRLAAGAAPGLFAAAPWRGTVGTVVRDRAGRLAAGTSTGGLTGKRYGRVGDTPLPGAGTYANGQIAVSCTGIGEEFIRHGIARDVAARMEYQAAAVEAAAAGAIGRLKPGCGGLIAVDAAGRLAAVFNTEAMYRGMAAADGRFEVDLFRRD